MVLRQNNQFLATTKRSSWISWVSYVIVFIVEHHNISGTTGVTADLLIVTSACSIESFTDFVELSIRLLGLHHFIHASERLLESFSDITWFKCLILFQFIDEVIWNVFRDLGTSVTIEDREDGIALAIIGFNLQFCNGSIFHRLTPALHFTARKLD